MTERPLARAEKTPAQLVVAQIKEISSLISKGKWVLGITEHEIAAKWGVDLMVVRKRAAEARRLVQNAFGNTEELRADIVLQMQSIARYRKDPQDRRNAIAALMGVAAVTGLIISHRVDQREPTPRHLTPAERRKQIEQIRAQLDQAERQVLEEENGVYVVPFENPGTPEE